MKVSNCKIVVAPATSETVEAVEPTIRQCIHCESRVFIIGRVMVSNMFNGVAGNAVVPKRVTV